MTTRIFVDRSRYEQYGRCPRSRYLQYHAGPGGMGIVAAKKPLPLAVGASVHVGLAALLRGAQRTMELSAKVDMPIHWGALEASAVQQALEDFAQYKTAIELPDAERAWVDIAAGDVAKDIMDVIDPSKKGDYGPLTNVRSDIDEYLFAEQSALVEALVRAYARWRLRPLLEQFEVLEVEREGEWLLAEYEAQGAPYGRAPSDRATELWFMSRPDALLRERESNQLYLLSYKTAASWDVRKARDAEHDMQGMSEGVEIERRLAEWWKFINRSDKYNRLKWVTSSMQNGVSEAQALEEYEEMGGDLPDLSVDKDRMFREKENCSVAMYDYLRALDAPPRILAVRMEYMLKSERWVDKDLTLQYGVEMRSQRSPLVRQYVAVSTPQRGIPGYAIGDVNCSWEYIQEDGRESKLAWQNFKSRPVWDQPGGVKAWIDKLDDAAPTMSAEDSTMGLEPRLLGYKCDAQVSGYLKEHPLDAVFIPPIVLYRQEDELRDMVEQMEAQERRIAEGVAAVNNATDAGEIRHLLNIHFSQTRRACSYPTQCAYVPICYGGEEIRSNPLGSGQFVIRQPNHPQENDAAANKV